MSYIYMIGGTHPPYKVGRSDNLAERMKALQTGHPTPLRAIIIARTETPVEHEKAVHFALRRHLLTGEWFQCDFSTIVAAMKDVGLEPELPDIEPANQWILPGAVVAWLTEMQRPPFFASEELCADLLGIKPAAMTAMKHAGMDRRTALACRALLHRMEPYS